MMLVHWKYLSMRLFRSVRKRQKKKWFKILTNNWKKCLTETCLNLTLIFLKIINMMFDRMRMIMKLNHFSINSRNYQRIDSIFKMLLCYSKISVQLSNSLKICISKIKSKKLKNGRRKIKSLRMGLESMKFYQSCII